MIININSNYTNKINFSANSGLNFLTRELKAKRVVNLHAITAGIATGTVAQVPGLDYLALTGVSAHMIHKLAKIYNIPWSNSLKTKLAGTLATEAACSSISDTFQYFPVIGNIGNGVLSVGITKITGNFFKSMFKSIAESNGKIKPEEINLNELQKALKDSVKKFCDFLKK